MSHIRTLQANALRVALPLLGAGLLSRMGWPVWVQLLLWAAALGVTLGALKKLTREAERPLQTLSNLLTALREGDFSFRAKAALPRDALGDVFLEMNALSGLLQQQRVQALEATALLRSVLDEIDVAVFAFDEADHLQLVNRAGEALLRPSARDLQGQGSEALGLSEALGQSGARVLELRLPSRSGRFEARTSTFRQGGQPHRLLVLSDLTRPLREEERRSWQRLIRVLGHEINNSLAPIQSLSGSIATLLERQPEDWQADARQGLGIIGSRAQALGRFMGSYTQLAKLPEPRLAVVDATLLARRVAALDPRLPIRLQEGPPCVFQGDEDQLEQALINLLRNGVEAAQEVSGTVSLTWNLQPDWIVFQIEDEGPGLPSSGNLFVPFFTTKPGGSGIGLLLARQIAENHGGSLTLANRLVRGACATLQLPVTSLTCAPPS